MHLSTSLDMDYMCLRPANLHLRLHQTAPPRADPLPLRNSAKRHPRSGWTGRVSVWVRRPRIMYPERSVQSQTIRTAALRAVCLLYPPQLCLRNPLARRGRFHLLVSKLRSCRVCLRDSSRASRRTLNAVRVQQPGKKERTRLHPSGKHHPLTIVPFRKT